MIKKVLTAICKIGMIIGFVVLFGSAGASDLETTTLTDIIFQVVIGLLLMLVGYVGLTVLREND